MMKQNVSLEISRNDKTYQFILAPDSPLGECFDVLCAFRQCILDRIKSESEKEPMLPKE